MSLASELISTLRKEFEDIKREYTMFFSGTTLVEPFDEREKMLRKVKRLRNITNLKTAEQFQSDALIAKIQSYVALWDRQIQNMGKAPARKKKNAVPPSTQSKPSGVAIGNPERERDGIVALYDEYVRQNVALGSSKQIGFTKFQAFIKTQTEKVKTSKNVGLVEYQIVTKDGKVLVKSKGLK